MQYLLFNSLQHTFQVLQELFPVGRWVVHPHQDIDIIRKQGFVAPEELAQAPSGVVSPNRASKRPDGYDGAETAAVGG